MSRVSKKKTVETVTQILNAPEQIEVTATAVKAIAHPLRLKLICLIADRELSVQELVEAVGTTQSNISQHLTMMRDKGILRSRKDANRVYYRVGDARTLQLVGMLNEVFNG